MDFNKNKMSKKYLLHSVSSHLTLPISMHLCIFFFLSLFLWTVGLVPMMSFSVQFYPYYPAWALLYPSSLAWMWWQLVVVPSTWSWSGVRETCTPGAGALRVVLASPPRMMPVLLKVRDVAIKVVF